MNQSSNIFPFDYSYSCVYLQNCKATGSLKLVVAPCFCLQVGTSATSEYDLDLIDGSY